MKAHWRRLLVSLPVERVEGLLTALNVTLKRLLLGVNANVNLQAVRREEGFSAALLVADKRVLPPVCLLMRPQVPRRAVCPLAALERALVSLHLQGAEEGQ